MPPPILISAASSVRQRATVSPVVIEHCRKHDLNELLELAIDIAAHNFILAAPIDVELEVDFDSDEQRPILNIPVAATVEETRNQYHAFMQEWVDRVSADSQLKIGFFPNIVESG